MKPRSKGGQNVTNGRKKPKRINDDAPDRFVGKGEVHSSILCGSTIPTGYHRQENVKRALFKRLHRTLMGIG